MESVLNWLAKRQMFQIASCSGRDSSSFRYVAWPEDPKKGARDSEGIEKQRRELEK